MDFKKEITNYENNIKIYAYRNKQGITPVMLTAVHTVEQNKNDGIKPNEPFTGAIAQYVANKVQASYFIKSIDNGIETNSETIDEFKILLLKYIKENNIKLLIDLHGAKQEREFDVELATLNDMTACLTTQNTLIDCFKTYGINTIHLNDPFKGGGITKYIYENTNIDIIQIEINHKYRNINNLDECEKVCLALTEFVKKYTNFIGENND